jgi:hypothetical protein
MFLPWRNKYISCVGEKDLDPGISYGSPGVLTGNIYLGDVLAPPPMSMHLYVKHSKDGK